MSRSTVDIPLDKAQITCTVQEVADTFAWLLVEMKAAAPRLRDDERAVLRRIMAHESKTFTVREVFPEFVRNSEAHKTLRRLRAGQFIRPARTGRWEPDEPIEVKPFGRLIWNKCGEQALFGVGAVDRTIATGSGTADESEFNLSCPYDQAEIKEVVIEVEEQVADQDYDLVDLLEYAQSETDGSTKR